MIDLHSHLLPNIDDGSRSAEQSAKVLRAFAEGGVTDVVLTPHLRASDAEGSAGEAAIERRASALAELTPAVPEKPKLHLGFEIMLDEPLPAVASGDRRVSLAGSRYYLVEFPLAIVADLARAILERLATTGVVPLVAHPERYSGCTVEAVARWRKVGARIQVDATTLTSTSRRGALARDIVARGLADVLAADNHGDTRSLATAREFLKAAGDSGEAAVEFLTTANPRAVIDDAEMMAVPEVAFKRGWLDRVKTFLG
jgi:protein-tyrosine phosphatase